MKKLIAIVFGIALVVPAFAAEKGTPEYQRLVEIKKAQREKREAEKKNPSLKPKSFWQKEAERSGLAGTGAMFTNPEAWKQSE